MCPPFCNTWFQRFLYFCLFLPRQINWTPEEMQHFFVERGRWLTYLLLTHCPKEGEKGRVVGESSNAATWSILKESCKMPWKIRLEVGGGKTYLATLLGGYVHYFYLLKSNIKVARFLQWTVNHNDWHGDILTKLCELSNSSWANNFRHSIAPNCNLRSVLGNCQTYCRFDGKDCWMLGIWTENLNIFAFG